MAYAVSLVASGNPEYEGRASAELTLDGYLPTMGFGDLPGYGQSEARTSRGAEYILYAAQPNSLHLHGVPGRTVASIHRIGDKGFSRKLISRSSIDPA